MLTQDIGAASFGLVVGWLAHSAFWQIKRIDLKWITAFIAVIGGGTVAALFSGEAFGAYSIGLAVSFFLRMLLFSPAAELISRRWFPPVPPPSNDASPPPLRLTALHNTKWKVDVEQVEGPGGVPYRNTLILKLRVEGARIKGEFTDRAPEYGMQDTFDVSGRLYFEAYLQLDCHTKKPGPVQFSTWLVELHDNPTVMRGRFMGYGPIVGKIIYGEVTLTKV